MALVVICSPLRAATPDEVEKNKAYAREALRNSLLRGEAPFASHLLYTQVLSDEIPEERAAAITAAHQVIMRAERLAVYIDRGVTDGMKDEIRIASVSGVRIVFRTMRHPTADMPISTHVQGVSLAEVFDFAEEIIEGAEPCSTECATETSADAGQAGSSGNATIIPLHRS